MYLNKILTDYSEMYGDYTWKQLAEQFTCIWLRPEEFEILQTSLRDEMDKYRHRYFSIKNNRITFSPDIKNSIMIKSMIPIMNKVVPLKAKYVFLRRKFVLNNKKYCLL